MTMDSRELAKALAEKAKAVSVSNSPYEAKVDYQFALGYLTGTLQEILSHMTPAQRETIAKQYGLL